MLVFFESSCDNFFDNFYLRSRMTWNGFTPPPPSEFFCQKILMSFSSLYCFFTPLQMVLLEIYMLHLRERSLLLPSPYNQRHPYIIAKLSLPLSLAWASLLIINLCILINICVVYHYFYHYYSVSICFSIDKVLLRSTCSLT